MSGIGFRIKEERLRLGLNQPDFAAIVGVSKRTVIDWEKEVSSPTAVQLSVFAQSGLDVLYVLTGSRQSIVQATPLDNRERALLNNYRESDDTGKRAVEAAASALAGGVSKSKASSE